MKNETKEGEYIKTSYSLKDASNYNPNISLGEVIEGKIEHLLDKALEEPHIVFITKNQLFWSDKPFSDLPKDDYRRIPLVGGFNTLAKHIPGRKPTDSEMRRQQHLYGFAIDWPSKSLLSLVQQKFNSITKAFIKREQNILPIPFRTYVDSVGNVFDPAWNNAEPFAANYYSGYVFIDSEKTKEISRFLTSEDAPLWKKKQYFVAQKTSINQYMKKDKQLLGQLDGNSDIMRRTIEITSKIKVSLPENDRKMLIELVKN